MFPDNLVTFEEMNVWPGSVIVFVLSQRWNDSVDEDRLSTGYRAKMFSSSNSRRL